MMKMKRCLIVTGGTIDIAFAKDFLSQRSYDYVIAADAGLEVLRPLHISPNAVVGDQSDAEFADKCLRCIYNINRIEKVTYRHADSTSQTAVKAAD